MNDYTFLSDEEKEFESLLKDRVISKWDEIKTEEVVLSDKEKKKFNTTIENSLKTHRLKKTDSIIERRFIYSGSRTLEIIVLKLDLPNMEKDTPESFAKKFKKCSVYDYVNISYSDTSSDS